MKACQRVAVISADREKFLGYGVYLGDFDCHALSEYWANEADRLGLYPDVAAGYRSGKIQSKNPKIELDSGETIWGCECWWGPEDEFKASGQAEKYGVEVT
jgi:hypothetical protein